MPDERRKPAKFEPNAMVKELRVKTIEQYMHAIDEVYGVLWESSLAERLKYGKKLWFRGVKAFDYMLLPTIGRNELNVDYEGIYFSSFIAKAIPSMNPARIYPIIEEIGAYWEWLFLMHENSYPTRILEWTEDALAALAFAVDAEATDQEKEKDAAVWCLNPVMLNTAFTFHDYYPGGYIPNVQEKEVYKFFGPHQKVENKRPAAVYSPIHNFRMILQRAAYTVFPFTVPIVSMNWLPDSHKFLMKIIVERSGKESIAEQLRRYGIAKEQFLQDADIHILELFDEE